MPAAFYFLRQLPDLHHGRSEERVDDGALADGGLPRKTSRFPLYERGKSVYALARFRAANDAFANIIILRKFRFFKVAFVPHQHGSYSLRKTVDDDLVRKQKVGRGLGSKHDETDVHVGDVRAHERV